MNNYNNKSFFENQFIYPAPEGSELIVTAPFSDGVSSVKQFVRKYI